MGAIKTAARNVVLHLKTEECIEYDPMDLVFAFGCLKKALQQQDNPALDDFSRSSKELFNVCHKVANPDESERYLTVCLENADMRVLCEAPDVIKKAYTETKDMLDEKCDVAVSEFIDNIDALLEKQFNNRPADYICKIKKLTK